MKNMALYVSLLALVPTGLRARDVSECVGLLKPNKDNPTEASKTEYAKCLGFAQAPDGSFPKEHDKMDTKKSDLRDQFLNSNSLSDPAVGDRLPPDESIATGVRDCPGIDPKSLPAATRDKEINVGQDKTLNYADFLDQISKQDALFCSLGKPLLDSADRALAGTPEAFKNKILEKRRDLMNQLGLDDYTQGLNFQNFSPSKLKDISEEALNAVDEAVKKYADEPKEVLEQALEEISKTGIDDVEREVAAVLDKVKDVGPEMLEQLKKEWGIKEKEEYKFDPLPRFYLPEKPKRAPFKVKKDKVWTGWSFGDTSSFATTSKASLSIDATEEYQNFSGDAHANIVVLGKPVLDIVRVTAQLGNLKRKGPNGEVTFDKDKVGYQASLVIVNKELIPEDIKEKTAPSRLIFADAKTIHKDFGGSASMMIAFVKLSVEASAVGDLGVMYSMQVLNSEAIGNITPYVRLDGTGSVSAGIPFLVEAGITTNLLVVNARVPVTGGAAIRFTEEGYPFLNVYLNGDVESKFIKGRLYGWVEGLGGIARAEKDIMNFEGFDFNRRIFGWDLHLGPDGAEVKGELIDQQDVEEAALWKDAISYEDMLNRFTKQRDKFAKGAEDLGKTVWNDLNQQAHAQELAINQLVNQQNDRMKESLDSLAGIIGR